MKTLQTLLFCLFLIPSLFSQTSAEELEKKATEHLNQKNWAEAVDALGQAKSAYNEMGDTAKWLAISIEEATLYPKVNQFEKADSVFADLEKKVIEIKMEQSPIYAILKTRWGTIWSDKGNQPKAIEHFEDALNACKADDKNFDDIRIKLLYWLGIAKGRNRSTTEALKYFQKGLEEISNLEDTEEYQLKEMEFRANVGEKKVETGNYEEGMSELKSLCIEIENEKYKNKREAEVFQFVFLKYGGALARLGDYENAINWLNRSETILIKEFPESHLKIATANNFIGICFYSMQEFKKAIPHYFKAKESFAKHFNPNHPSVASVYNNLGICYDEMENFEDAISNHEKALEIRQKTFGNDHRQTGQSKLNLGNDLLRSGNCSSSLNYHKDALRIYRNNYGEKHPRTASTFMAVAKSFSTCEKFDSALVYVNGALFAITDENPETISYDYNPSFDELKDKDLVIEILQDKISILNSTANSSGDEKMKYLTAASETADLAHRLFLHKREKFNFQNLSKTTLLKRHQNLYKNAVLTALYLFEETKEKNHLQEAFGWAEAGKSLLLLEAFQGSEAKLNDMIPQSIIDEEKIILDSINQLELKIEDLRKNGNNDIAEMLEGNNLFQLKRKNLDFQEKIKKDYPSFYELTYDLSSASIEEIINCLDDESILIEFVEVTESNQWAIITIDNQGNVNAEINLTQEDTQQKVEQLNSLLQSTTLTRADKRKKFIELSHDMYLQFISPIEKHIEGKKRLIVVGEGILNYIPFEVFLKTKNDLPFEQLDYLINNFETSYHYSSTLFHQSQKSVNQNFENDLLAFAPVFADAGASAIDRQANRDTTLRAFSDGGGFSPLPYSEKEVLEIIKLFEEKGISNNLKLTKAKASEKELKLNIENEYKFIHLASHSFVDLNNAKFSGIACSAPLEKSTEDGLLHVGEIYNMNINSDLVVLSSCESGIGKMEKGEGLLGLNRSFIYSGVPNVIFTLWKINDKTSSEFVVDFYSEVLEGKSYGTALRNAKLKSISESATASPNLWAAYLLVGR